MALKMVKMALKMVKNHKNYTGIFDSYQKCRSFDVSTTVENVPNYSSFDFRLSRYIFTKLLEFPKALSKCMFLFFQRDTSNLTSSGGQYLIIESESNRTTPMEKGLQPFVKKRVQYSGSRFSKLTRGLRQSATYVIDIAR